MKNPSENKDYNLEFILFKSKICIRQDLFSRIGLYRIFTKTLYRESLMKNPSENKRLQSRICSIFLKSKICIG